MGAMYRSLLPLLLWISSAVAAPQEPINSNITYVKIEPVVEVIPVEKIDNHRQSRIEILPLTIPGNLTQEKEEVKDNQPEVRTNPKFKRSDNRSKEDSQENTSQEKSKKFQRKYTFVKRPKTTEEPVTKATESKPKEVTETNTTPSKPDTLKTEENKSVNINVSENSLANIKVSENSEELHEIKEDFLSDGSDVDPTAVDFISDSVVADTKKSEKQILDITTANYETNDPGTGEVTTIKIEAQNTTRSTVTEVENITKPTTAKLGYFGKSPSTGLNNFIDRTRKRHFRSRCRCEKIWNCPKLQITVPRCPDEYFLCCF